MPRTVCIIGVGLIGGSLGMALRRVRYRGQSGRRYTVTGVGRNLRNLRRAKSLGAVDGFSTDYRSAYDADIVVLAVPVQDILAVARKLLPFLRKGAVLTDVGSVKSEIVSGMHRLLRRRAGVSFVGAHPMAGSEKVGVENARPNLFSAATCVITAGKTGCSARTIENMWRDAGARCLRLDAKKHDAWVALTSHLPHVLAFLLVSEFAREARRDGRIRAVTASSFRDLTRVAGADPYLWSGILSMNRAAISGALKAFRDSMGRFGLSDEKRLREKLKRLVSERNRLPQFNDSREKTPK